MMIYILYRPVKDIFAEIQSQDTPLSVLEQKNALRAYRHHYLNQHCPNLVLGKLPEGKPVCLSHPDFVFNHSHSQHHYALAWSDQVQDLGVDIEDLNRKVKMHALAKRSFHPNEYAMWQATEFCPEYWFKVWTIKEAVLKAHGMGIRIDLHSIDTAAHPHWNFGRVSHAVLGEFFYQNMKLSASMLTVAYRATDLMIQEMTLISQ